jgi:hypothetical protein
MAMTKEELRQKYPLTLYPEKHWEIYDEVDARVVAFFFTEADAHEYLEWKNTKNGATTSE